MEQPHLHEHRPNRQHLHLQIGNERGTILEVLIYFSIVRLTYLSCKGQDMIQTDTVMNMFETH